MSTKTADRFANPSFWDGIAEKYSRRPVDDPAAFDRKTAFTKALIGPGRVLLDVGCGTGSLALRLADSGAEIHALDASAEMIRIARSKKDDQGADNVTFHRGAFDASFERFLPESLDVVCAYSLLHLAGDRSGMLAHAHRLLKPGGRFISSTLCLGESWAPYGLLLGVMRRLGKAPHVSIFTKETLLADIRQAGFENVHEVDVGAISTVAFISAEKKTKQQR